MKRILAFVVVLSVLLSVCSISAAAAPLYSVEADTQPFVYNTKASVLDNAVSLASVEYSDLSSLFQSYLSTQTSSGRQTVADLLLSINSALTNSSYDLSLTNLLDDIRSNTWAAGNYLNQNGGTTSSSLTNVGIASLVRNGFMGLAVKLDDVAAAVDGGSDYTSVLSQILTASNNINASVGNVNTSVGNVNTAVGNVNTSVGQVNSSIGVLNTSITSLISEFSVPVGSNVLGSLGSPTSFSLRSFSDMVRIGFLGLGSGLRLEGSGSGLGSSGTVISYSNGTKYGTLMRDGFLGLRSLIGGSESDNVYSLTLWDNNNDSSSANATGLGPMFRIALGNVGENLAKLTFMFAADDDIELKADSQPVLDEVTDTVFGSGSGKVKLDVSNVSDLTGMSDDVLGYFETGGQIGDINTVVNDDSTWLWFTSQTAADLDTTSSSLSRAAVELEPEADSHTEWYASFYRDVLGRDYVGG